MLQLGQQYLNSKLSRRSFFRKMSAAGMSAASAPSVLDALDPSLEAAAPGQQPTEEGQGITVQAKSAFFEWMESEGIPTYAGYAVDDVAHVKLGPWKRLGASGAMIYLSGDGGVVSAYVCEIEPGRKTLPERHMHDERIFVLSGRGETNVWQTGKRRVIARWQAGTLFAMPLNALHEHVNTGTEPARLIAAVNAPLIIDTYRNLDYVFKCDFQFTDRFNSQSDFFKPLSSKAVPPKGRRYAYSITNLVPDLYTVELYPAGHGTMGKGVGTVNHHFVMAGDTLDSHVEEWKSGVYEMGHRHGPGAQVMILKGQGYSLIWPQSAGTRPFAEGNGDKVIRVPWRANTLFVPPLGWFHHHFNTGPTPARMVKLGEFGSRYYLLTSRDTFNQVPIPILYKDEDPKIREMFETELKNNGVPSRMPSLEELQNN